MRRSVLFLVIISLWISLPLVASAAISETAHDLSDGRDDGQLCVFCHVPHNPVDKTLLWARSIPSGTFTMYSSDTLTGDGGTISGDLSGTTSLLCLSCHDGVTASDITLNDGTTDLGGDTGKDLSNDHPVNITYAYGTGEGTDPGLKNPDGLTCQLFSGKVQCASCHNVHGQDATEAGVTNVAYQDGHGNIYKFLRVSPQESQICIDCHDK